MPAGPGLGDGPAAGLLTRLQRRLRAAPLQAQVRPVVRDGVLVVAAGGVPGAQREGARAVADLHQVAEGITGLVAG